MPNGVAAVFCSLLVTVLASVASADGRVETALDRYVAAPDPSYRYELISTESGDAYAANVLEMTSQRWRTAAEVDRPLWKHWLTIVRPQHVNDEYWPPRHQRRFQRETAAENQSFANPPGTDDAQVHRQRCRWPIFSTWLFPILFRWAQRRELPSYLPNADHSFKGEYVDAAEGALTFYQSILANTPRPSFRWACEDDGSIRIKTEAKPAAVTLWQAVNEQARDFRLQSIGRAYTSSNLTDQGDGLYIGTVTQPKQGWKAYFVEITFPSAGPYRYQFTTGVRVTPERLPFVSPPEVEGTAARSGTASDR
jgi:PhoPQ-activated pathogenicity-related protein